MIDSQPGSENRTATAASQPPAAAAPPPLPAAHSASSAPAGVKLPGWSVWHIAPSWLLSTALHLGCIIALAAVTVAKVPLWHSAPPPAVLSSAERDELGSDETLPPPPDDELAGGPGKHLDELLTPTAASSLGDAPTAISPVGLPMAPTLESRHHTLVSPDALSPGSEQKPLGASNRRSGKGADGAPGEAFAARMSLEKRAEMVKRHGGTFESESAVSRALYWLSKHQFPDGGWRFDHRRCPECDGQCGNPGPYPDAEIASTAFALLPFLGAGETHLEGQYKPNVKQGLQYLLRAMGPGGNLWQTGGRMYGHGLASIALCEAYGMTRDPKLRKPAQMAVNFIVAAQDQNGGGWRYDPGMAGDTSIFGWQMMALTSAKMAYLEVPDETIRKASYFLDGVQAENGAMYMYMNPGGPPQRESTCAIGLLCRMYLGWKREHPPFVAGVERLSKLGPNCSILATAEERSDPNANMYYNYYGTQLMFHYGGDAWTKWNGKMRDFLVESQASEGHESGSWYFSSGYDFGPLSGGRLYCTAMAAMTLEVYYRHLPLYSELSVKDPFH